MKSLIAQSHALSDAQRQINTINNHSEKVKNLDKFEEKLKEIDLFPLKPTGIEIFQINVGYMCNMTCKHCHVDAGPDRQEIMTKETLQHCLDAIKSSDDVKTVDLTGGAPEMNPHFRWFVDEVSKLGKHIIVRSNLTILDTRKFEDLPQFMADRNVEITCSLPFYSKRRTDQQRGEGTYDKSMKILKLLNGIGYGKQENLELNLVYNPVGAFLPPDQESLEQQYKDRLWDDHGIMFNNLFTITNLPISRYLNFLVMSDNLEEYMEKLITAFNPGAAQGVMCRNTISIGWDGSLYDCDFNQMLELKTNHGAPDHIEDWDIDKLNNREIIVNQHCYGCTAGAGSSCGGTTT